MRIFKSITIILILLLLSCSEQKKESKQIHWKDKVQLDNNGDTTRLSRTFESTECLYFYKNNLPAMMLTYEQGKLDGTYYYLQGDSLIFGTNYFYGGYSTNFISYKGDIMSSYLIVRGRDSIECRYNEKSYINLTEKKSPELLLNQDSIYFNEYNISELVGKEIDHLIYISDLSENYNKTPTTKTRKLESSTFKYEDNYSMIGLVFQSDEYDSSVISLPIPPYLDYLNPDDIPNLKNYLRGATTLPNVSSFIKKKQKLNSQI